MIPPIPVIKLKNGEIFDGTSIDDIADNFKDSSLSLIHITDLNADEAGAPQNIQVVHQALTKLSTPVQFQGGIETIHTAELVLGLGVSYVVLDRALKKTERAPAYFFKRLGDKAVARVQNQQELDLVVSEGAKRILYTQGDETMITLPDGVVALIEPFSPSQRNLQAASDVGFAGALIEYAQFGTEYQWKQ